MFGLFLNNQNDEYPFLLSLKVYKVMGDERLKLGELIL